MEKRSRAGVVVTVACVLMGAICAGGWKLAKAPTQSLPQSPAQSQPQQPAQSPEKSGGAAVKPAEKGAAMSRHASGAFDVKMVPQTADEKTGAAGVSMWTSDKQYHGDLEATAKGQMLAAGKPETGSAGYVAIEMISGTLQGRKGTFAVMHSGTMTHGAQQLSVTVVPGSSTGQLAGIAGKMEIKIKEGKHFYELEYTLPEAK